MKFLHLADLHLGKRENGFSLLEDQEYILDRILEIVNEESPDFVLIAGDIYDKLTPPEKAVSLLDSFLSELASRKTEVFIIAGNHDSAERVAFGSRIMDIGGIHFSPVYSGKPAKYTVTDEYGEADIFLLPYLIPSAVKRFFPDAEINSTDDAVRTAVNALDIDESRRNIIVSHQFVTGGVTSESERNSVGGTDTVSADVYEPFDYAALGHLHAPQFMGSSKIRYSGTPLKYSMSEEKHKKSVTICTLGRKGEPVEVKQRELVPMRDMRSIRGSFDELIAGESDDYIGIILTDISRIPDAHLKLRAKYPHLMELKYEREMERSEHRISPAAYNEKKDPLELFSEFFVSANGKEMTDRQCEHMRELINEIWG